MSVFSFGSDKVDIFEVGDEMTLRGWHLDRQQFPSSLHVTVNHSQVEMVDAFLSDLTESFHRARRFGLRKALNAAMLTGAQTAARVLPERLLTSITERAAGLLGGGGPSPQSRSAALYGMMGSLPNRGDLKAVVLDLVEQFTQPQE